MRGFLIALCISLALVLAAASVDSREYSATLNRVIDGDTYEMTYGSTQRYIKANGSRCSWRSALMNTTRRSMPAAVRGKARRPGERQSSLMRGLRARSSPCLLRYRPDRTWTRSVGALDALPTRESLLAPLCLLRAWRGRSSAAVTKDGAMTEITFVWAFL